jgi:hypothetical protein
VRRQAIEPFRHRHRANDVEPVVVHERRQVLHPCADLWFESAVPDSLPTVIEKSMKSLVHRHSPRAFRSMVQASTYTEPVSDYVNLHELAVQILINCLFPAALRRR